MYSPFTQGLSNRRSHKKSKIEENSENYTLECLKLFLVTENTLSELKSLIITEVANKLPALPEHNNWSSNCYISKSREIINV